MDPELVKKLVLPTKKHERFILKERCPRKRILSAKTDTFESGTKRPQKPVTYGLLPVVSVLERCPLIRESKKEVKIGRDQL